MQNISERQRHVLEVVKSLDTASFSTIYAQLNGDAAERTIKRDLSDLTELGYLKLSGGGRSIVYQVTTHGRLCMPIDAESYNAIDLDTRTGVCERYQSSIWNSWPSSLFSEPEHAQLSELTRNYHARSKGQSSDIHARELERFVIEMSWKSSQIEGNTYTLLDTETLLKEGVPSSKNTKEETQMILNHKTAFDFVLDNINAFQNSISFSLIETIHQLLTKDLLHEQGLRTGIVGITGTRYQPPDNQYQLREAVEQLTKVIHTTEDVYTQALTTLLGISYIQPFTDGNKRTARLLTNGMLIAGKCAPLSYRDVDVRTYRASLLVFYEQLSVVPMKDLFMTQYQFSTEHYRAL